MNNKKPPRANEPYMQEEINLILSLIPTKDNVKLIAKSLGRSEGAIKYLYKFAYSGEWLKGGLAAMGEEQNHVYRKVAFAKKKLGILVGHEPK